MSRLKVLIVDDELPARNRLRALLADCAEPPVEIAGEAAHGREALEKCETTQPDLVLLDIRMPEMDGIELAQHLMKLPQPPGVIFTTAYDDYALKAFEVNAVDYLLKPIRLERLQSALSRARQMKPIPQQALAQLAHKPRSNLSIQEAGRVHLIPLADIVYLRAELKYITVRTVEREYLLDESLAQLEQEFAEVFIRIHRNCLVAKACISGFERVIEAGESRWVTVLKGLGEKLPVSRRQHSVVREFGRIGRR
ncbi:MAG TPA: LytTR family DNA-binding domain-containing protein [Burkholderiales bacterium]|nr:LytTR family DNA-binding domain-containing protein [Burkholderiales bacterium]